MATYPGAWWTFSVASTLDTHPSVARGHHVTGTRLYQPDAHAWYFIPPVVLDSLLQARPTELPAAPSVHFRGPRQVGRLGDMALGQMSTDYLR
jgi:hypothetical protein